MSSLCPTPQAGKRSSRGEEAGPRLQQGAEPGVGATDDLPAPPARSGSGRRCPDTPGMCSQGPLGLRLCSSWSWAVVLALAAGRPRQSQAPALQFKKTQCNQEKGSAGPYMRIFHCSPAIRARLPPAPQGRDHPLGTMERRAALCPSSQGSPPGKAALSPFRPECWRLPMPCAARCSFLLSPEL